MAKKDWLKAGADGLEFGERLEDLYRSKGINQTQLAEAVGLKQSAISEYINGKDGVPRAPDCASLIALAKYFSVSTDYLLGLTTTRTTDESVRSVCNLTGISEENVIRMIDWQVGENNYALHGIANLCIESAFCSLWDYIRIYETKKSLDNYTPKAQVQDQELWKETLGEVETIDRASEYGYTVLEHKDAIKFYARSIANQLERYLEEVYTNGID